MRYVVLYSPSSVQRIMDFIKTAYAFENVVPVILKPIGAAAQIGIPEAYKYSYRLGKSFIVLSEINDLFEVLKVSKSYYISPRGEKKTVKELIGEDNIALIVSGGEGEPSKRELEKTTIVSFEEIPDDLPPSPYIALLLYLVQHR